MGCVKTFCCIAQRMTIRRVFLARVHILVQGGEGCNTAAEFNIENSLDELDAPAEWYLDIGSGDLYFFPNNTECVRLSKHVSNSGTRQCVNVQLNKTWV